MNHLDEGMVVTLRDGGAVDALAMAHVGDCVGCADRLEDARRRHQAISEALASLDEPVDVLAAKAAVRRRLDARRGQPRRIGWWHTHLGRAAALLVLTAGAVSALPGSPVRDWLAGGSAATVAVQPTDQAPVAGAAQTSPAGISVAVPEGRIAVVVRGAEPGTVIEVTWVDRPAARVSAAEGSGFTYADGRAEVEAAPGPIRVELPRSASSVTLEVAGRLFLERSGERLSVPGPAVEQNDGGVRFVVPAL